MKFGKRFGVHFGNGQQYIMCVAIQLILMGIDIITGGTFTLLTFLFFALSQSVIAHALLSLIYACEKKVEKIILIEKKAGR